MNGARNTQPPHSARLARGDRGGLCCVMTFFRGLVCVIVALSIALLPLDAQLNLGLDNLCIQKNEAHANPAAIPIAGTALAALAAELGISETALILGIGAVAVGATGLSFVNYQASGTDTSLAPAPGFKPWDDLTPEEKSIWGSNGEGESWPQNYQENAIGWWALQYGLLDQLPNGDLEPSQEPDPENDPNGHSRWQKAKNVMIALAAGGGAIALNDALGPLIDNAAASLKQLLFGSGSNGNLGLDYAVSVTLNDVTIPFTTKDISFSSTQYGTTTPTSWWFRSNVDSDRQLYLNSESTLDISFSYRNNGWQSPNMGRIKGASIWNSDGRITGASWTTPVTFSGNNDYMLNEAYQGRYIFGDYIYQNGQWNTNPNLNLQYGQMQDTPSDLPQAIYNNNVVNYINNYTNPGVQDYTRALTIPDNINDPDYDPQYSDFVVVTPDEDITQIPDDEQLPGPGPPPEPTPDEIYQSDFGQKVGELLSQPFNQLFPFCLIGDLYTLTQKIESAVYPSVDLSTQDLVIINGTSELVIPLDDFGVTGMDNIELDLTPIVEFGNMVRPWTTTIFIVLLLVGTFRFFLNRGGE